MRREGDSRGTWGITWSTPSEPHSPGGRRAGPQFLGNLRAGPVSPPAPTLGEQHLPGSDPMMRAKGGHCFPHPSGRPDNSLVPPKPLGDQHPVARSNPGPRPDRACRPKHAASGAGAADCAAPGRPTPSGGHAPPAGAVAPVTLRVPTPRAGRGRLGETARTRGWPPGTPASPKSRRHSRQGPEDPQVIHLQFEVTEDPASGGHANHDSHNAAGKLHVPRCTAPRAGAVGLHSLRGRRAPRAGAVGPGRLRWGELGVAGHDWPSQGRGSDTVGRAQGWAGGGLQARGAGGAAPPSAVPHSLGSPRCSLPLRTHGSLKKSPSLAFVFSDKCVQFPLG